MKKTISFFFFCFFSFFGTLVFANEESQLQAVLSLSSEEVAVGEPVKLILNLKSSHQSAVFGMGQFEIPGVESFAHISTTQSTSIQKVNNITLSSAEITKTIMPLQQGSFDIGPVRVPVQIKEGVSEFVESNIVRVRVLPEKKKASSSLPPQQMGDLTYTPPSPEEKISVALFPEGNWIFWLQILSVFLIGWGIVLWVSYARKSKKSGDIKNIQKENVDFVRIIKQIPDGNDPEFFLKIQKVFESLASHLWSIKPSQLTTQELKDRLQSTFSVDESLTFFSLWNEYREARFAGKSLDKPIFRDRLELFCRKHIESLFH